jgi:hypothetical protein
MFKVFSATSDRFSGDEILIGNLFSGDESFRGLLAESDAFRGDWVFGVGEVRLFSIFNGEVGSRSIGLFEVNRESLFGEMFSQSSAGLATFATKGELGGSSLSVSVEVVVMVTS